MIYTLSKNSLNNLEGVKDVLKQVPLQAIKETIIDFGILYTGGLRTAEMQNGLFKQGFSKCDGYNKKSYHQSGLAVDIIPYIDGEYTWKDKQSILDLAKIIFKVSEKLDLQGYYLHWGGFWNFKDLNDNNILEVSDTLGWDATHWELRKSKQKNTIKL
jgi:peptidoglycan LD-endopeptidase CwlK